MFCDNYRDNLNVFKTNYKKDLFFRNKNKIEIYLKYRMVQDTVSLLLIKIKDDKKRNK